MNHSTGRKNWAVLQGPSAQLPSRSDGRNALFAPLSATSWFIVRRLIELNRVSSRIKTLKVNVFSAPVTRNITQLNPDRLDKNYDWTAEKPEKQSVLHICNQCIHAYLSFVDRGPDRNWSDLIVVSDFDRNKAIWRIPFTIIIGLFDAASEDWPTSVRMDYAPELSDYRVTID